MLVVHLLVDGVQGFFTPTDAHVHAGLFEDRFDFALHFLDQVAAAVAGARDGFGQDRIAPRQQVLEGQVLQFAVDLVQTQAVGDWRVDFQGFRGNASPFAARHVVHGAHVVGAIGQFDQDDPHVAGHGQQHLAKGLGLVFFAGVELELFQLGQTVHQLGHGSPKSLDQLRFGDAAVFHGIVQQGGR